jgi:hydroxymethylpyrimidine/phosphomethylpyrimidine kinase
VSTVLLIAGSDSSGGAGIACDLRTLAHFGVEPYCALTAVTVQSDQEVRALHPLPPDLVRTQIETALGTRRIGAIKIGMLATAAVVRAVTDSLPPRTELPIVLDPVLAASSGGALLDAAGCAALLTSLLPRVTLLTPNLPEAAALLGCALATTEEEATRQARSLLALGPAAVLVKGGHGSGSEAVDLLVESGGAAYRLAAPRSPRALRGTGCALSSGIAAGLAAGLELGAACARAKQYVSELLHNG